MEKDTLLVHELTPPLSVDGILGEQGELIEKGLPKIKHHIISLINEKLDRAVEAMDVTTEIAKPVLLIRFVYLPVNYTGMKTRIPMRVTCRVLNGYDVITALAIRIPYGDNRSDHNYRCYLSDGDLVNRNITSSIEGLNVQLNAAADIIVKEMNARFAKEGDGRVSYSLRITTAHDRWNSENLMNMIFTV